MKPAHQTPQSKTFGMRQIRHGLLVALAGWVLTQSALADNDGGSRRGGQGSSGQMTLSQMNAKYREECAACHMAYPPGFLPAVSWKHQMNTLEKHYGADAGLDAATVQSIDRWLQAEGGTYKRAGEVTADHRISSSAWFERKHREIAAATWKRVGIKSKANCVACHTQAEQGNFDEKAVRIPKL